VTHGGLVRSYPDVGRQFLQPLSTSAEVIVHAHAGTLNCACRSALAYYVEGGPVEGPVTLHFGHLEHSPTQFETS
jgi:hypothetical protein